VTDKEGLSCPPVPWPSDVVPLHSVVLVSEQKFSFLHTRSLLIIVELISLGLWAFDLGLLPLLLVS
jgi:hypothetical protein